MLNTLGVGVQADLQVERDPVGVDACAAVGGERQRAEHEAEPEHDLEAARPDRDVREAARLGEPEEVDRAAEVEREAGRDHRDRAETGSVNGAV